MLEYLSTSAHGERRTVAEATRASSQQQAASSKKQAASSKQPAASSKKQLQVQVELDVSVVAAGAAGQLSLLKLVASTSDSCSSLQQKHGHSLSRRNPRWRDPAALSTFQDSRQSWPATRPATEKINEGGSMRTRHCLQSSDQNGNKSGIQLVYTMPILVLTITNRLLLVCLLP